MIVANSSDRTEDIVIRLRQNDINKCVFVTRVKAKTRHTIKFSCNGLRAGKFTRYVTWAKSSANMANIAKRIN